MKINTWQVQWDFHLRGSIRYLLHLSALNLSLSPCHADEEIEAIIARGRQVRCLFVYASDSEPCSAMRGIMWELQRKVRQFHHSAETFWLHNGSIVNRNLVEFSKWELPVPSPWLINWEIFSCIDCFFGIAIFPIILY